MDKNKKHKRIYGYVLSNKKHLDQALTKVFGIGSTSSKKLSKLFGFSNSIKINDLSEYDINILVKNLQKYNSCLEKEKRKRNIKTFKHYASNKTIKGFRLKNGLPVHGQRTRSNAQTARLSKKKK